ncbi:MAG: hypothetical protein A3K19_33805 [Lentisphaerae bacterium RIFOXYB12_FULL_65_16]|nr:MAG: hypothetical protein A3K19_23260 [Lentisphaerae bacterium RIFOXYB12_FULL_65_16]OGV95232.1 MAG: hypothetical protein A3K19_33805 [Lentisphaerae bacterium RIFOXYB12_FULL_65_16]
MVRVLRHAPHYSTGETSARACLDESGLESVDIRLNDQRLGVAVGRYDDNDQHLFFTAAPVDVTSGDRLELRTLSPVGRYRIEDIVLLREKPEPRQPVYEFRNIQISEDRLT